MFISHFLTRPNICLARPSLFKIPSVTNCNSHISFSGHSLLTRLTQSPSLSLYPKRLLHTTMVTSLRRSARLVSAGNIESSTTAQGPESVPQRNPRKRKTPNEDVGPGASEPEKAPSTPKKKQVKMPGNPPPATPTPQEVSLVAEGASLNGNTAGTSKRPRPAAVTRLADPNKTNATLLSPESSRIITPKPVDAVSPSKAPRGSGLKNSIDDNVKPITTATLLEEACAHLINVDERMKPLIENHRCHIFSPEGLAEKIDPFEAIASSIISQQVSGAAAKAIKARFISLFDTDTADKETGEEGKEEFSLAGNRRFPHPSQVVATPIEKLRTAGLSQRKAEYVSGLAEKFASGELSAQMLADAPYEEILEKLIAVRGLGRWSVEMFACFALKRLDVFSLGDLGVQRGMAAFVGRDVAKLKAKGGKWKYMTEKEMEEISDRFRPYRSLFMWYMWRVEETDVSTLE